MDNLKTQPRYDRGINYLVAGRLSLFYDYSLQLQLLPSSQNFFFNFTFTPGASKLQDNEFTNWVALSVLGSPKVQLKTSY